MKNPQIKSVLVLGGGSAGLLTALTLKRQLPGLDVEVIHSEKIGVIGVGEGTTAVFPEHLFKTLGIPPQRFYEEAEPTWKIGVRFLWGKRGEFFYDFGFQYDERFPGMERPTGFYAEDDCRYLNDNCALMQHDKAFLSGPLNKPVIQSGYAFHIENAKLVKCLRHIVEEGGVKFTEDTLLEAELRDGRLDRLVFESGQTRSADLFIDASGFRSELLGKALKEPFKSFSEGLFCDRAIVAGWERTDEPIAPYTTAETMDCGWSWQIEHENFINRGYVFSSDFISEDEAIAELLGKNPRITSEPGPVRFRSGRYQRNWIENVVAVGNASGFVEPLEATALAQIIYGSQWLAVTLKEAGLQPGAGEKERYNLEMGRAWDEIRDFLAFHYKFNALKNTPFWRHCREKTSLGDYQGFFEAYQKMGPSEELVKHLPHVPNIYGIEGYLAMLVGMKVPHQGKHQTSDQELESWGRRRRFHQMRAKAGLTVAEALKAIRAPNWKWA